LYPSIVRPGTAHNPTPTGIHREAHVEKPAIKRALELYAKFMRFILVELSGIEPLTSSLRIQDVTSDGETPDDPK